MMYVKGYWYNADNPEDKKFAEAVIRNALKEVAAEDEVRLQPIEWDDVDPLSPMVPPPPAFLQGDIRCLIGFAASTSTAIPQSFFTDDLTDEDLHKMRTATRRAHKKAGGGDLSDEQCDQQINDTGPGVAGAEIMRKLH